MKHNRAHLHRDLEDIIDNMRALGLALSTCDFHLLRIFRRHRGALVDRSLRWDIEESVELEDEDGSVRLRNLPGNERLGSNQLPVQLNISLNRALLSMCGYNKTADTSKIFLRSST